MQNRNFRDLLLHALDVSLWRVNHAGCDILAGAAFDKLGGIAMLADYGNYGEQQHRLHAGLSAPERGGGTSSSAGI